MDITFQYWEECLSHEEAFQRLRQVMAEENIQAPVQFTKVETWEQAEQLHFIGSPIILVNGKDIQPPPSGAYYALTCRTYYKTHTLSDYKDKDAVAVIFSCNHCPYVKAWEDRMVEIQRDYGPKGVQLIVINANDVSKVPDDSFPKMKERAKDKGFNFPYLFDESQGVARSYGAERTPEVFLFDKQGQLRYHGAIDDNYDNPSAVKEPYLRNALDAVLGIKPLSLGSTEAKGCTIKWK